MSASDCTLQVCCVWCLSTRFISAYLGESRRISANLGQVQPSAAYRPRSLLPYAYERYLQASRSMSANLGASRRISAHLDESRLTEHHLLRRPPSRS